MLVPNLARSGPSRRSPSGSTGWQLSASAQAQIEQAEQQSARVADANRKRKYSPGDRVAYEAVRVDFPSRTHCTAYYAITAINDAEIFIHGGQSSGANMLDPSKAECDSCVWRCTSDTQVEATQIDSVSTDPLVGHSAVCYKGVRLLIYGGCGPYVNGLFGDVFATNLRSGASAVLLTSSPQPAGRSRHACTLANNLMYIHGGHCHRSGNRILDDFWSLDIITAKWQKLSTNRVNHESLKELTDEGLIAACRGPGVRYGHHMAYWNGWIFIALGSDGGQALTDIWAYNEEERYWNAIIPKEKQPEPRLDCASAVFGEEKWLFHGGFDPREQSMINSFYEFNFRTHEGRQLRVELKVQPLKLLPAMKGHGMASVKQKTKEGKQENLLLIFGGINRMDSVVHVVYVVKETGRGCGVLNETAEMPPFVAPLPSPKTPRGPKEDTEDHILQTISTAGSSVSSFRKANEWRSDALKQTAVREESGELLTPSTHRFSTAEDNSQVKTKTDHYGKWNCDVSAHKNLIQQLESDNLGLRRQLCALEAEIQRLRSISFEVVANLEESMKMLKEAHEVNTTE